MGTKIFWNIILLPKNNFIFYVCTTMWNIAVNTLKEIIRNKFLYLILIFALLFIILSVSLGKLTIGESEKIILDFWIALIEIFWVIGVLFVWSQLLFKEIEWKTIFLILSKPIQRYEFILGKFFGFAGVITLITLLQSILFLLVLFIKNIPIDSLVLFSLFFILLKLFILIGLVLFFSTFISPILTIFITIMVYLIAHSFSVLISLFQSFQYNSLAIWVWFVQLAFPPFEALNIKDTIGTFITFSGMYFVQNIAYAIVYLAVILVFTCLIFNKKKFEN